MSQAKEYPSFIQNSPIGEDKFKGKAQDKLAEAIASLISKKEPKSKILGLEGEWGGGKSNVISILKKKLNKTHHVYIHDVWGFQEDLQRRTFLESLTSNLCNPQDEGGQPFLKNKAKWDKKLKELLARRKETTVDVIPVLSKGFMLVIFFIVLWTIAGEFSGPIFLGGGGEFHKRTFVFVAAILVYLYASMKKRRFIRPKDVFYLYHEKDTKKVTNETIFEQEPSPDRFQKWVSDLQKDFPEKKELIVVFDNMDRLPKNKVLQIWSLIHTFFSEQHFNKIWVIVPYSRTHLSKAFNNQTETDHFVDKTFTIQHQVPPPIMSDWKSFFDDVFNEAYGRSEANELVAVRSTFDRKMNNITPRKIIMFINDTVALKKMWAEEIPLRYIGIYSLNKDSILEDPISHIISKDFLGNSASLFGDDPMLQDYISALVYNIPVASAAQIAIRQKLITVLREGNKNDINELAEQSFFVPLLESVVGIESDTNGFETTLHMIKPEIYENIDTGRILGIWNTLLANHKKIQVAKQQFTDIDKVLLSRIDGSARQKFVNKLIEDLGMVDENEFSGSTYYKTIKEIEEHLKENNLDGVKINTVLKSPTKTPEVFIDFLSAAKEEYAEYGLSVDNEALNTFLIGKTPNGLDNFTSVIHLIGNKNFDLTKFHQRLKDTINGNDATNKNLKSLLTLLKGFISDKPNDTILNVLKIKELLDPITKSDPNFPDLIAMRIKQHKSVPDEGTQTFSIIRSVDEELVKSVANCIENYTTLDDLITLSIQSPEPLIVKVTNTLITKVDKEKNRYVNVASILQKFQQACDTLALDQNHFLDFLDRRGGSADQEINKDNIVATVTIPSVYAHIVKNENKLCKHLIKCLIDHLKSITEKDWKAHLQNSASYQFAALYVLLENNKLRSLPKNAFSAYLKSLEDIAKGTFSIPASHAVHWQKFYDVSNKRNMTATLKDIRDIFTMGQTITPEQFKFFAPMFMERKTLKEDQGDVCRKILSVVIEDDSILNTIILKNQEYYASIITDAGEDAFNLKAQIKQLTTERAENTELENFANDLGIEEDKQKEKS